MLLGRRGEGGRPDRLERVLRGRNRAVDRTHRFELHPGDYLLAVALGRETGLTILGFYHSHPAGEARPSALDRHAAWDLHVTLLIAPERSGTWAMSAWKPDSSGWQPVDLFEGGQKIF